MKKACSAVLCVLLCFALQIGVFAESITNGLGEQGGKVHFKYQLDVNSVFLSENEIFIDVKTE